MLVSLNCFRICTFWFHFPYNFAPTPQCRPEIFKSTSVDGSSNGSLHGQTSQQEENVLESSDDEGLPPIEANTNRIRPKEFQPDAESDSSSDIDS